MLEINETYFDTCSKTASKIVRFTKEGDHIVDTEAEEEVVVEGRGGIGSFTSVEACSDDGGKVAEPDGGGGRLVFIVAEMD